MSNTTQYVGILTISRKVGETASGNDIVSFFESQEIAIVTISGNEINIRFEGESQGMFNGVQNEEMVV